MRAPFLILLIVIVGGPCFSQQIPDRPQLNNDSISAKREGRQDSLYTAYAKVDSIQTEFVQRAQSLKYSYDSVVGRIDSSRDQLQLTIDSLENYNLPTASYTEKLDSITRLKTGTEAKFNSRLAELKASTTDKLSALELPPQYKEHMEVLTQNVDRFTLHSDALSIPRLDITGYDLPVADGLNLPDSDISKFTSGSKLQAPIGDLGNVTGNIEGVQQDVKNITSGNLDQVKNIPEAIEDQAGKLQGVQELQNQSAAIEDVKAKLELVKDPAAGKEKAIGMAKDAAIDHFAGKDQQLKAAMDQMAKYKSKYSSVSSLKDLPKRPPNAMKGKRFRERVVPGLYFQYQVKGFNLFDFNPYAGYRISGRLTAGAGWNQRFARDKKHDTWNRNARIFGPRLYVDCRLYKEFIAHAETEVMNSFIHTDIKNSNYELGSREWVWGMMTGIKKEYKIYKNIRGTVLIQYNVFNPKYRAPYVDRLNSRIGLEYLLKTRKKPNSKKSSIK